MLTIQPKCANFNKFNAQDNQNQKVNKSAQPSFKGINWIELSKSAIPNNFGEVKPYFYVSDGAGIGCSEPHLINYIKNALNIKPDENKISILALTNEHKPLLRLDKRLKTGVQAWFYYQFVKANNETQRLELLDNFIIKKMGENIVEIMKETPAKTIEVNDFRQFTKILYRNVLP